jgi:hypothetical protein
MIRLVTLFVDFFLTLVAVKYNQKTSKLLQRTCSEIAKTQSFVTLLHSISSSSAPASSPDTYVSLSVLMQYCLVNILNMFCGYAQF